MHLNTCIKSTAQVSPSCHFSEWSIHMGREGPKYADTKIQRTGEEPHLSTSQSLTLMRTWKLTQSVSSSHRGRQWELRSLCTSHSRWAAEQVPDRSHPAVTATPQAPSGPSSSFPWLKSGTVPSYHWKLKAQIHAMTKLSHSWFKLTWALGNLLEDPLVKGLLKWSLVVKKKKKWTFL